MGTTATATVKGRHYTGQDVTTTVTEIGFGSFQITEVLSDGTVIRDGSYSVTPADQSAADVLAASINPRNY